MPGGVRKVVGALLVVDVSLIGIHAVLRVLKAAGTSAGIDFLDIESDGSLPEIFNYAKLGAVVLLLIAASRLARLGPFLVIALCFAIALLDDSLSLHERFGPQLAETLGLPTIAGIGSDHVGEFLFLAVIGGFFATTLWLGWRRVQGALRRTYLQFVILLCLLGFFAGAVDALHQVVYSFSKVGSGIVGLIEDGGEMIVITLTTGLAALLYVRAKAGDGLSTPDAGQSPQGTT